MTHGFGTTVLLCSDFSGPEVCEDAAREADHNDSIDINAEFEALADEDYSYFSTLSEVPTRTFAACCSE